MNLRSAVMLAAAMMIAGGAVGLLLGRHATPLLVWGCVIFVSLLIERWRYRPHPEKERPGEIRTGERFVDPDSGVTMEVNYDPKTGERRYAELPQRGPRN